MTVLLEGEAKARAVRSMFDSIAPRYDVLNRILTFRMDVGWRRRAVRELGLDRGSAVADLACGTGDLCRDLAVAGCVPLGFDVSMGMLAHAKTASPLVQADVSRLPVRGGVLDGAVCGFALRNLVDLAGFFAELARVVRPGGRIALLDVDEPEHPVLRWGHRIYFRRVVPRVGALLSDGSAYRYLPASTAYLPAPDVLVASLGASGFGAVERTVLSGGIAQLYTATRNAG